MKKLLKIGLVGSMALSAPLSAMELGDGFAGLVGGLVEGVAAFAGSDPVLKTAELAKQGIMWGAHVAGDAGSAFFNKMGGAIQARIDESREKTKKHYQGLIDEQQTLFDRYEHTNEKVAHECLKEIERLRKLRDDAVFKLEKPLTNFIDGVSEAGVQGVKALVAEAEKQRDHARALEIEALRAREERMGRAEAAAASARATAETYVKFVTEKPHVIIGIAAGIFALYYGIKYTSQYVYEAYKIPDIAQKTSFLSVSQRLHNWAYNIRPESDVTAVKLSPELAAHLHESSEGLKHMIANGSILLNKVFYGPPGVGKTEFALRLAAYSGMEYVYFSSAMLEMLSMEDITRKVVELFRRAESSPIPVMIVVDEAELVFADRMRLFHDGNSVLNQKRLAINNLFLTHTSKGSKHYMVIAITNFLDQLDAAFLSRCNEKIYFSEPDASVRREILDHYIDRYLVRGEHLDLQDRRAGLQKVLSWIFPRAHEPEKVLIPEGVLSEEVRSAIAARLDGWVGRDIEYFVTAIEEAARYADNTVTPAVIEKALSQAVAQRKLATELEKIRQKRVAS